MIRRFSSRRQPIDESFLNQRLLGARSYDRIAGYFSSSILEVAGEALETISGPIRVICNSELQPDDVKTAQAANYAIRREWCAFEPEKLGVAAQPRFKQLFELLRSERMVVRVLPADKFGLVHGKAGVITLSDGGKTAFMGSTNETYSAFRMNYELVWEDDSDEAVEWVQAEFDALWNHPMAHPLAEFVFEDLDRLSRRQVIAHVDDWRAAPEAAAPVVESPVYRKEFGLWAHQKSFVKLAFDAHRSPHGARLVLADMVGLGKTLQLGMAAQLMALYGKRPVLVLAPKTLLWQWQDELKSMLDVPSAVWTGRAWVDENEIEHPAAGPQSIRKCPRRIGLVSQGLVTRGSEAATYLRELRYECVIVDEAHRSRRRNLGSDRENEAPDPNNLMRFLLEISARSKSMLLATATPVQLYPVEAWDLLHVLAVPGEHVLGNAWSHWRKPSEALSAVVGKAEQLPVDEHALWGWIRNPFPFSSEGRDFERVRRSLQVGDDDAVLPGDSWDKLRSSDQAVVRALARDYLPNHNPFIRSIVRRTREYLETTINPETNEPYLKPVKVELFGEDDREAIVLPPYLRDAYAEAEEFCRLLGSRVQGAGFLKTLLLRRVGSTIYAGQMTAQKMLDSWEDVPDSEAEEEEDWSEFRSLTPAERSHLEAFVAALSANQERDPKYQVVMGCLRGRGWLDQGCIVFSQYFDSVWWLAGQITKDLPGESIGIYGGGQRSGVMRRGEFERLDREQIKLMVKRGDLRLLLGTDAASEGLNLQKLGTLINLDLPWNPTRLEQRKGRIQRIGQLRDTVFVYNMRYKNSVEDRVHELLSDRLGNLYSLFGQIPDVLEDVWIQIALGEIEQAKRTIAALPAKHPFEVKYHKIEDVPWESCAKVLDAQDRKRHLSTAW